MKSTTIFFVRHGETDANLINLVQGQTDVPLNQNGIKQAEIVGRRLHNTHFDCIYSSDLVRTKFTAQCIANGRKINYTPKLREWSLGHWEDKTLDQIKELFPEEFNLYNTVSDNFQPQGGESTKDFQQRAADFLSFIAEKHQGEKILCVSHGGFIRNVLKTVLAVDKFTNRPRIDNTAISAFKTADGGKTWQLLFWNDSAHLQQVNESNAY